MLGEGNNPRHYTGCQRKGQTETENELVRQHQVLDGADNERSVENG